MIAIGILLAVVGIVGLRVYGSAPYNELNKCDYVFASALICGLTLTLAGCAVFVWRTLP